MNRRLMMAQQQKGFELVYDAASGEFPDADKKWVYINTGWYSERKIENNLLYCSVDHLYSQQRYRPNGHFQAKRSEVIIEVENWSTYAWDSNNGCILGVVLTDGTYYAACNLMDGKMCIGKVSGKSTVAEGGIWANLKNIGYSFPQKFTFRMVFDSGMAYYYIDDELMYTQTDFLDKTTIQGETISANEMYNTIRFGSCAFTYISKITYKEW